MPHSGKRWLLDPQPECIPGAADEARRADRLERDERKLGERLAFERDAQRPDALVLRYRRDQRLLRHGVGLELAGLACGHRDVHIGARARPERARRALPYIE